MLAKRWQCRGIAQDSDENRKLSRRVDCAQLVAYAVKRGLVRIDEI